MKRSLSFSLAVVCFLTACVRVEEAGVLTQEPAGQEPEEHGAGDPPQIVIPETAVDMGLSVRWASCNVGASRPEEYGDYFAWGEVSGYMDGKTDFDWSNYRWCDGGDMYALTKYNTATPSSYGPVTDNKTQLDISVNPEMNDDVARSRWGGNWRMPTKAEFEELLNPDNCDAAWGTRNGVRGCQITSRKTGNSIFLPAAGFFPGNSLGMNGYAGYYWSSTLEPSFPPDACYFEFNEYETKMVQYPRSCGHSVRPVFGAPSQKISSILLSKTSFCMLPGNTETLVATVTPLWAPEKEMTWSSSDPDVATVDDEGVVTALSKGTATISAAARDGSGVTGTCAVQVVIFPEGAVDMGLSVKWDACNIGASSPEEYGDYFAWGEVSGYMDGKTSFDWSNYRWCNGTYNTLTKYNSNSTFGQEDGKTQLDLSGNPAENDDAARARKGAPWRMPTQAEFGELRNPALCTALGTTLNGVYGFLITSRTTGNSIFLPAGGYRTDTGLYSSGFRGCYWSSSRYIRADCAYFLSFHSSPGYINECEHVARFWGHSVRSVSAL